MFKPHFLPYFVASICDILLPSQFLIDNAISCQTLILQEHIYPSDEFNKLMEILHKCKLSKKYLFKFKWNTKNSFKKHKFPRTTREHTQFDKYPYETTCPNCLNYIRTEIYHYNTYVTHTMAAIFLPVCMCMIPYYTNEYKNTAHYCPQCKIYLGTKFGEGRHIFHYHYVENNIYL